MKDLRNLWRSFGLYVVPLVLVAWLFYTDVDHGVTTVSMLTNFAVGMLAVTLAHLARKYVFPYIRLEDFVRLARGSSTGAGLVVLSMSIFLVGCLLVFAPRARAQDVGTFVPAGAFKYCPQLQAERARLHPGAHAPETLCSLVEQESCITLKHPRCWNPAARLKTEREEGAGMGQVTRAYSDDGALRFDSLEAVRSLDPALVEWSWSNVYDRPDLQLRAIVVMNRDCDRRMARLIAAREPRLHFCDAAYNGGWSGLQQERRACGLRAGCDPQQWFGHVEQVCLKSKARWRGYGKSACEINREHVSMVMVTRRAKYRQFVGPL